MDNMVPIVFHVFQFLRKRNIFFQVLFDIIFIYSWELPKFYENNF